MKVMLVCSSGGHLAQLHRLRPWWEQHDRMWVTFASALNAAIWSLNR